MDGYDDHIVGDAARPFRHRWAAERTGRRPHAVAIQRDFNAALSDALTSGIGALVDTDMGVIATHLQALQTRQRLGMQALSIANDNAGAFLRLLG